MVTVADVRTQLAELGSTLLSDSIIQQQIDIATAYLDAVKKDDADATLLENTKLLYSSYLSFLAYVEIVHREIGEVPTFAESQRTALLEQVTRYFALVVDPRKAVEFRVAIVSVPPVIGFNESVLDFPSG